MKNKDDNSIKIKRLQENLLSIRKIAGWTSEQLGKEIGVTKQTISNLENKKTSMNLTQYIAIRAILDKKIKTNPENILLPQVIEILIDKDFDEEESQKIQETMKAVAAIAISGVTGKSLFTSACSLLNPIGLILPIPIGQISTIVISAWLKNLKDK